MLKSLEILFEDADLLAVNKPSGILCEGGGEREEDLEAMASRQVGKRALCCHRLDRLTSGVLLLRKTARWRPQLAQMFEQRQTRKEYWALVDGLWNPKLQKVETQIGPLGGGVWANVETGGKPAVTTFRVLGSDERTRVSWLSLLLKTGRTHQARLHCLKGGCPILGDPVYGKGGAPDKLFGLHARSLTLRHPGTGQELVLVAEPPLSWNDTLGRFGGGCRSGC